MLVMLANTTGIHTGYLAGRFPGKIGHLFSPGAQRGPFEFAAYALDNGRFTSGEDWSEAKWVKLLDWARLSGQRPRWVLVPDVVGNREATLSEWKRYAAIAESYGWPLAFAVQDGMDVTDVPLDAAVVFVGGTTEWKWQTVAMWCNAFPRVHIGRVNTYRRLFECHDAGAESIDGTGWMRGNQRQYRGLLAYLDQSTGRTMRPIQHELGGDYAVRVS